MACSYLYNVAFAGAVLSYIALGIILLVLAWKVCVRGGGWWGQRV